MDDLPDERREAAGLEEAVPANPPLLKGPKRQHFLPRFYLDGFGRGGMLAVYDRTLNEMRVQKPEGTGVIGHFYTLEDDHGRKRFELEQALSEVEDKAAPIIKKLANKGELTADERSDMAIFVALGMCRTPDLIDSIKQMNGHMVKHMTKLMFCSVERAKEILRNGHDAPATEEELEKQAKELVDFVERDQYEVETHHGWALGMSMEMFTTIAPILSGRDWLLVHRDNDKGSFVTSDAPLVLTTTEPRENQFWGIGFANADALVLFPLTESCALLIFGEGGGLVHRTVGQGQIRHLNLMVADRCQRFVIGRDVALVKSLVEHLNLGKKQWMPKMRAG